jgi:hypothetical protein
VDELVRRLERDALTGDPEAVRRYSLELRRTGVEPTTLPVDERINVGLFDTFLTRLRDDIVEEARRTAQEEDAFSEGVNLDPCWWPVDLLVNGRRLVDLVGGGYNPQLPAHAVFLPTRRLLGEHYSGPGAWADRDDDDDTTLLLFCECGDSLCGRLVAKITASERAVVWSCLDHRPSPTKTLHEHQTTFVFSRREYEAALRDPRPPSPPARS